jgi:predicted DCC family thiol-disulfide oxidoreductase YuxK
MHVILYDGTCGFCSKSVQFMLRHDRTGEFRFAKLQGDLARTALEKHGKRAADLDTVYLIENYGTDTERVLMRSRAALACAARMGFPWNLSGVFRILPTALLDSAYDLFAKHRYRIFGQVDACMLPDPAVRDRFLD